MLKALTHLTLGVLAGLTVVYAIAWFGMHLLDQPDIFWLVNGISQ